ncbi:leucine-rich repeat-containing protein 45 isoform X1 [Triplophysa rosa]|uniref:Leucine-rich repeat-containing protein 45 n=1 Tax=Triplophysa rosa TaxID=992332 RepID=A0A9W7WE59_TRIRA|nr:leucine-rich repeat-containing protein 45 isoform X1 [Triplophysa rosa]XP_057215423.1 leucine-rich repeat-containing protein 45 isoform X1 [Triplophysa rosa]KAI7796621.1 putative leucine-rich repeat-containing protein 45 [Triplophysa rosa]
MEDFRRTYQRLCKEGGIDTQESVLAQLDTRTVTGSRRLDLSGQSITVDTCSALGRVLQNDTVFTEIILSDCMLSEEGAKLLLHGLCSNTTVKMLDLKGNNMRGTGAEALGQLLVRNKILRRLVLEWNALGMWEEGFAIFCEGLASNTSLTQLDLRNNQINHQGAAELCIALKRNTTLQELDLRWNNIGLLGGRSLLEAMQQNRTLLKLEMAGNNIPSDTLRAIEQSMNHNTDRQSTLRESRSKTHVLTKEIQLLKDEKGRQFLSLMETIDRQKDEMGRSSRNSSTRLGQLQEALNEQKSAVNSLTAKLQMTEAALALSQQKSHGLGELLTRVKMEKTELREKQSRDIKKEQEESALREAKLLKEVNALSEKNLQLLNKLDETERRCKMQQEQIFELKQELTNTTAELKLRLVQNEERLDTEKRRSKQTLEDMDSLRQKEVDHLTRHQEDSERALQDRILKLEGQRIQLEEELSRVKASLVTERAQAEEELGKVRAQVRLEEQQHLSSLEEKLRAVRQSRDESQNHCTQQKQTVAELLARVGQQSIEMDTLRRRIEELQQELAGKEQEKVAEVARVRVELQEQIGHLQAERTAQGGLKEKIAALEREMKVLSSTHREALLDKESEISSLLERLRIREGEIQRMREDEAQRASFLQNAIHTYVQGSPLAHFSPKK